jgi:N-acetylmuramoyl-L-alanine amidase
MGNMHRAFGIAFVTALVTAAPASAGVPHVVQSGETLWTIAAANNFTTRALAAANGLSENSNVVLGSTIQIPSISEASAALTNAGIVPATGTTAPAGQQTGTVPVSSSSGQASPLGGYAVQPGDTLSGIAAAHGVSLASLAAANGVSPDSFAIAGTTLKIPSASAAPASSSSASGPPPLGGYTVRPGDSLSGIAAQAGVSVQQLAWMNGLNPDHYLLAGTVIKLPTGAPTPSNPAPAPTQTIVPAAAPNPTNERVDSSQIAQVAAAHGVPASLASAIAWQESGFNNSMVSSANARGVMQIMPGTWDWVNKTLATGNPLNPNSAIENVRGGVLYLRQLLNDFNGDSNLAAAAYYQGEGAVKSRGLYPETQQYVNSVNALRTRFGG